MEGRSGGFHIRLSVFMRISCSYCAHLRPLFPAKQVFEKDSGVALHENFVALHENPFGNAEANKLMNERRKH